MLVELTADATLLVRPETVAEQVALRVLGTKRPNAPVVRFNAQSGAVELMELDFDLRSAVVARPAVTTP